MTGLNPEPKNQDPTKFPYLITSKKFILSPFSSQRAMWDAVILIVMVYVSFITPFQIAFIEVEADTNVDALFILDRLVDVIFVVDFFLSFVTGCVLIGRPAHYLILFHAMPEHMMTIKGVG